MKQSHRLVGVGMAAQIPEGVAEGMADQIPDWVAEGMADQIPGSMAEQMVAEQMAVLYQWQDHK